MAANLAPATHRARKNTLTASQSLVSNTVTTITLPTTDTAYTQGTAVGTGTSNALVANVSGFYRVSITLTVGSGTTGIRAIFVLVNGVETRTFLNYQVSGNGWSGSLYDDLPLTAGDVVTLAALAPAALTVNALSRSGLTMTYLGP